MQRRSTADIRAAIVDAAVRVAGRCGVGGLTHRVVAEEAGVSLSSTTYHFKSKEDIVSAALQRVAEQETAKARVAIDALSARDGDLAPQARQLLDAVIDELAPKDRVALRAQYELQLYAADHPHLQAVVRAWIDGIEEMFAEVLHRIGAKEPAQSARLMVAVIDGLRLTALTTSPSDESAAKDRAAITLLRDNLLPTAKPGAKPRSTGPTSSR